MRGGHFEVMKWALANGCKFEKKASINEAMEPTSP
jgi:hypothetical protein